MNTVLVTVAMKYAVWKDETYGYAYGTIEQSKGKEIVEYCKDYDEARITWKWYYYKSYPLTTGTHINPQNVMFLFNGDIDKLKNMSYDN